MKKLLLCILFTGLTSYTFSMNTKYQLIVNSNNVAYGKYTQATIYPAPTSTTNSIIDFFDNDGKLVNSTSSIEVKDTKKDFDLHEDYIGSYYNTIQKQWEYVYEDNE